MIVDGEKPARRRLSELLEQEAEIETAICSGGVEVIQAIRAQSPNLVFLNIQMPEVNGFQVLKAVGLEQMPTVFVSAYDRYALRAFDACAIDYLLKPYSDERFEMALERAKQFIRAGKPDVLLQRTQTLLNGFQHHGEIQQELLASDTPPYLDRLVLKSKERVSFLKVEEIAWIKAAGVYVELHAIAQTYLHRELLGNLEQRLEPQQFVRIHRTIVNIEQIEEMLPDSHGEYEVVLKNRTRLRLSRTDRPKLQARLGQQL